MCGLQWTVTFHQLAKTARRRAIVAREKADKYREHPDLAEYMDREATFREHLADDLEGWANAIGESRGKVKLAA